MRLLLAAILVIALPACAHAAPNPPAMVKGDSALTGGVDAPPPRSLLGVRFRFHAGGPIRGTPVWSGGIVYFGSDDGYLYALDSRTGRLRWRFAAGAGVGSSPSISGGIVAFTAWNGTLYALDAASGRLRWKTALGADLGTMNYWDFYTSSPTPVGGTLYVGSGDGHLYAFDRATGRRLWAHDTGARIRGTPAVSGGIVVVGTMDGQVVAVDRTTGAPRWTFATDGAAHTFVLKNNDTTAIPASPSILAGVVTIGARDGNLYAVDLASGALRWKITHNGGSWILSTAMQGSTVFSGSGSAYVIQSARVADGGENWRFKTRSAVFGPVTVAGDVLVASDLEGVVYAVDTASGHALWEFPMDDHAFGGPLIADGAVFAGTDSGSVVALDTAIVAAPAGPRRLVYAEASPKPDAFRWFQRDIDRALLADFAGFGYDRADDAGLIAAMNDQIAGKESSVIVFADGHLPAAAADESKGPSLIRRFVDAGGVAIFLGINPLSLRYDEKGEIADVDEEAGLKALGIAPLDRRTDRGYPVGHYTAEGERWGLSGTVIPQAAADPKQVDSVLASDRLGNAVAWAKAYPGRGLAVFLPIPRNRLGEPSEVRAAVDHAVAHGPGR